MKDMGVLLMIIGAVVLVLRLGYLYGTNSPASRADRP